MAIISIRVCDSAFLRDLMRIWTVSSYDRPIIRPNFSYMHPTQQMAALYKSYGQFKQPTYISITHAKVLKISATVLIINADGWWEIKPLLMATQNFVTIPQHFQTQRWKLSSVSQFLKLFYLHCYIICLV